MHWLYPSLFTILFLGLVITQIKLRNTRKELSAIRKLTTEHFLITKDVIDEVEGTKNKYFEVNSQLIQRTEYLLDFTEKSRGIIQSTTKILEGQMKINEENVEVTRNIMELLDVLYKTGNTFNVIQPQKKNYTNYSQSPNSFKNINKTKKTEKNKKYNRQTMEKLLPNAIKGQGNKTWDDIVASFGNVCPLTNSKNFTLEHFIPVSTGHAGTIPGNIFPLHPLLNYSKNSRNPWKWIRRNDFPVEINYEQWNFLVEYLAEVNNLTVPEYIDFVNWCFNNPRTEEQVMQDGDISSIELWKRSLEVTEKQLVSI
ncbi:hypothetical protein bcgnr5376_55850 [Bacillus cereus]